MTLFRFTLRLCALLGVFAILISETALAQSAKAPDSDGFIARVGVFDINRVHQQSAAVKDIFKQIDDYRKNFDAGQKSEQDALEKANQSLKNSEAILSPEAYAAKRREFETQVVNARQVFQEHKRNLEQSRRIAMSEVEKVLSVIIREIAETNDLNLIIRQEATYLSSRSMDISTLAIETLNTRLPSVKVKEPGTK